MGANDRGVDQVTFAIALARESFEKLRKRA